MQLHNLKPAGGSVGKRKRIARGQGSGHGGTATRGHKGDKSRSGHKTKRNFEGGQMPIQMRLPKRGFKNPNRTEYVALNLGRLQDISEKFGVDTLDPATLVELGIVRKNDLIKVLGSGELNTKLTVTVHACSETAKTAIEAKGGSINLV
jgi:large subunit ribosomal protein L15